MGNDGLPKWLKNYYGSMLSTVNPEVIIDGKKVAVVRLQTQNTTTSGSSRIGYVLISKDGKHNATAHVSLHEGVPTQKDMERMRRVFEEADV
jgi:hypothetical protein